MDFVQLPPRPHFFDSQISIEDRYRLLFLHSFVNDVSKKIERDGKEHVEYVPTQIVTEWVRMLSLNGERVDGIRYPSAQCSGGSSIVLFVTGDNIARPYQIVRDQALDGICRWLRRNAAPPFWDFENPSELENEWIESEIDTIQQQRVVGAR